MSADSRNSHKKLRFLKEVYTDRPGSQTFHAFNRSLSNAGIPGIALQPYPVITDIGRYLDHRNRLRNYFQIPGRAYILAIEWIYEERLFPICYFAEIIPLCFDCWPKDYQLWLDIFHRHRIRIAFFTARQSCEYFKQQLPDMSCHWLPEAADPSEYRFQRPLADRTIDVLELGRRFEWYNEEIREPLARAGYVHRFRAEGQRRIFPTQSDLLEAWGETKISICFPKNITDPVKSGGVETVTFRYFESMASGCLLVGHCPTELEEIFGYNPVIEADMIKPAEQLLSILDKIDTYQWLIEKNLQRMLEVGSWDVRVQRMLSTLLSSGYHV
jgi:hypothetical protein